MPKEQSARKHHARYSTKFLKPQSPLPSAKGRNPSRTKSEQYPHEEIQQRRFAKNTIRNINERIERVKLSTTVDQLKQQCFQMFPVDNLALVTGSLIVTDDNGCPLIFFLKKALTWPLEKDPTCTGLEALQHFVKEYPPPSPKRTDKRHNDKEHRDGTGVHHLAFWHAVGHGKSGLDHPSNCAVLSKDLARVACRKQNATATFLNAFTPITQAIGALFELVDRENYQQYNTLFHQLADNTTAKSIQTTNQNCFLGMAILTNLCCCPHWDQNDILDGWVADVAFGDFEGGQLQVPQTGWQFELCPGDVIFMRSALLQHSVAEITGHRFGVVYFTHASLMDI